jgi:hypothetical protein
LRCLPVDVLVWNLDVACLAVYTTVNSVSNGTHLKYVVDLLLCVDLETHSDILAVVLNIFIHTCRTEAILHTLV